jgi:hypothetical protein
MQKLSAPKAQIVTVVRDLLAKLPPALAEENLCVLCLCQVGHERYSSACNPFFFITSTNVIPIAGAVLNFCHSLVNMNASLDVTIYCYYQILPLAQFESLAKTLPDLPEEESAFLREALAAYHMAAENIQNVHATIPACVTVPRYSEMI